MVTPYSPLAFVEALDRERRPDPRILAARGDSTQNRPSVAHRLGRTVIRLVRMARGTRREPIPTLT